MSFVESATDCLQFGQVAAAVAAGAADAAVAVGAADLGAGLGEALGFEAALTGSSFAWEASAPSWSIIGRVWVVGGEGRVVFDGKPICVNNINVNSFSLVVQQRGVRIKP